MRSVGLRPESIRLSPSANFIFRDFRTRQGLSRGGTTATAANVERLAGLGFFYPFRLSADTSSREAELQKLTLRRSLARLPAPVRRRRRSRSVGPGRARFFRRSNNFFKRGDGGVQAAALSFELGQNTWKVHRGISPRSPRIFPYGVKNVRLCTFCSVFRTNLETPRLLGYSRGETGPATRWTSVTSSRLPLQGTLIPVENRPRAAIPTARQFSRGALSLR